MWYNGGVTINNAEKCFLDGPVVNFELDPRVDYYVAVGTHPERKKLSLHLGRQTVTVAGLTSLTQGPGAWPQTMDSLHRHATEAEEEAIAEDWKEGGFYLAVLSVNGFTAHLRDRGPRSTLVLGRGDESALPFTDTSVSRRHVSVSRHTDGFEAPSGMQYVKLQDLHSMNGTYVTTQIDKDL